MPRALRPHLVVVAATHTEHAEDALAGLRALRDRMPFPPALLAFGGPAFAQTALSTADTRSFMRLEDDVRAAAGQLAAAANPAAR